jgi:hypothetical protein
MTDRVRVIGKVHHVQDRGEQRGCLGDFLFLFWLLPYSPIPHT